VPFGTVRDSTGRYSGRMHVTSGTPVTAGGILKDAGALLALVLFIPFAILLIGAPVALVIAGLLWLARLAFGAF
jgi:hypothetical protein